MIVGIGCDIVAIKRIESSLNTHGDKFLNKNFSHAEISNSPDNKKLKSSYYAKRFAGKEAFSKALGSGIGGNVEFKEIEILNEVSGKPYVKCDKFPNYSIHISLSDEKDSALAFVVIECKK